MVYMVTHKEILPEVEMRNHRRVFYYSAYIIYIIDMQILIDILIDIVNAEIE